MRHLLSLILFLFCSISLLAQSNNDTLTVTLKGVTVRSILHPHSDSIICIIPEKKIFNNLISLKSIHIRRPSKIVHTNQSEFGLTIGAFRFENVNQMANTVAGVLSMDGEIPSFLGSRRSGTAYYINEVRVLEGFLPDCIEN